MLGKMAIFRKNLDVFTLVRFIHYLIVDRYLLLFIIIFCLFVFQVCELDIIFNFEKAYFILDEFLLGGEVQETSKKNVLKAIEQADLLQEVSLEFSRH